MYKGYKIQLFPNAEQEALMWKHIDASRFIWNYMLEYQIKAHERGEKHLKDYDMIRLLTPLKKQTDTAWLYEVSNATLQQVCKNLEFAYKTFFDKTNYFPRFKEKGKSKTSFAVRSNKIRFEDDKVWIEKLKFVKIKRPYEISGKIIHPTITYHNNKWILSFSIECDNQAIVTNGKRMGIDLGIKEMAVVAYENQKIVFHNINKSKRVRTLEHKLKHIRRVVMKKYRTNGNYEKTNGILKYENMQREIYNKLENIRNNYIHQTTHALIKMAPSTIVIEDLNIRDMMKNKHVAKDLADLALFEFIRQMKYKCSWHGINLIQADRWYPSSKTCSACGFKKDKLKLSDRVYVCKNCGLEIDRDYNAAINLMRYVPPLERCTA